MAAIAMEGRLAPGDERAEEVWRAAWTAERQALLAFFRRQVRDPEVAEDLLQETFVRAIRAGRIDAGTSLRSYLFTIGQNLVADHWRRRFRVVARSGEGPSEEEGGLDAVADVRSESPEQATSRRALERSVREAMRALPDHYRSAFRMAAIEQRSYREIGECLGWTLDQVRINVHRARKRLIAELGELAAGRTS